VHAAHHNRNPHWQRRGHMHRNEKRDTRKGGIRSAPPLCQYCYGVVTVLVADATSVATPAPSIVAGAWKLKAVAVWVEFAPLVVVITRFKVSVPTPARFPTVLGAVFARLNVCPLAVTVPVNVAVLDATTPLEVLVDCAVTPVEVIPAPTSFRSPPRRCSAPSRNPGWCARCSAPSP